MFNKNKKNNFVEMLLKYDTWKLTERQIGIEKIVKIYLCNIMNTEFIFNYTKGTLSANGINIPIDKKGYIKLYNHVNNVQTISNEENLEKIYKKLMNATKEKENKHEI